MLPWYFWIPMGCFGLSSVLCLARSYAHLTPEAKQEGPRAVLRGALTRQNIFTARGWQLRLWAWALAALALLTLAIAGIRAAQTS